MKIFDIGEEYCYSKKDGYVTLRMRVGATVSFLEWANRPKERGKGFYPDVLPDNPKFLFAESYFEEFADIDKVMLDEHREVKIILFYEYRYKPIKIQSRLEILDLDG